MKKKKKKKKKSKKTETIKPDDIQEQGRDQDKTPVVEITTQSMANVYISQGLYDDAMKVYKALLSKDPDSRLMLQQIDDLKLLITLSGSKYKK